MVRRTGGWLAALLTLTACSGGGGVRPVALPAPAVTPETTRRLAVDESAREPAVLPVLGAVEGTTDGTSPTAEGPLRFAEVMVAVERSFPLVLAALEEVEIAEAEVLAAEGGFDLRVRGGLDSSLQGYYESDSASLGLEQPTTLWGATLFGGYKYGEGDFPVWEGGRKTRTGGEVRAGVRVPLLAGRSIDPRRAALWKARIQRAAADPKVLARRLDATREAALVYWGWVAAGQRLDIAERLLELARTRQAGIEESVDAGQFAPIALVENRRLIVERESIALRAERDLRQAAIRLSLFWRGADGAPRVPSRADLPGLLPSPRDPASILRDEDLGLALARRPEVQLGRLALETMDVELARRENDVLPRVDVAVAGSQDLGAATADPDDKGPFEFDAFLDVELPLQRRSARGALDAGRARRRQMERELTLAEDRVAAEVRDVRLRLEVSWARLERVRENARLAATLEEAERAELAEGTSDLLRVNLREQQTAAAASMLVDAVAEHFRGLAEYRAVLGVPYGAGPLPDPRTSPAP